MPIPFRMPRLPFALGLILAALLIAGGGAAWWLARAGVRAPLRVLLVSPAPPEAAGLDAAQARAIAAIVQDHLEWAGGCAVTSLTRLPGDLSALRGAPRTLVVELHPERQNDRLVLTYRYLWARDLARNPVPAWTDHAASAEDPAEGLQRFLRGFPQQIPAPPRGLAPRQPAVFWDLVQASAWRLQNTDLHRAMALAEEATRREPGCASTWILLGNLRYRWMLNSPAAFRQEQADTEACLQRGLALAPNHPRASFLLSLLKADSGNQPEALDLLFQARRHQPHNPTLLTGIAYAARGAGLLPLARRAMDLRDQLAFTALQPQAVDITCLYTGEIPRFEASLQERPGHLRSTSGVLPFYRGYLALVRGDRSLAHREFQAAADLAHGYPNILRLAEIFDLILEDRKGDAWKKLREYDQERLGMREPDGEFTLRLAEAYALAGDRASAMEMANRAFARGFGCTAWYERSPMLESLRSLPKWKALLQHLKERQALMEERYPVGLLEGN